MTVALRGAAPMIWSTLPLIKCLAIATSIEVLLHTASLPKVCTVLGIRFKHDANAPGAGAALTVRVQRVAAQVDEVYRRFALPDSCLRRALVAGRLLREDQPELVLGVRTAPHFQAHAWLVVGGAILDWSNRHAEFRRL